MTRAEHGGGPGERTVLMAVGLADLAVETLGTTVGTLRSLLGRSDTSELAADAKSDLRARGRLTLDRYTTVPPAYLEVLARHAAARRAADHDV
ncbi:polyprenyl synthetase [Streptomyces sp. NBC_00057]|uniref:polyprenyl synthetase n=1 Tax=Streptomyces sp. NBC_00057 TaxID=2975634 RepID=UPI003247A44D